MDKLLQFLSEKTNGLTNRFKVPNVQYVKSDNLLIVRLIYKTTDSPPTQEEIAQVKDLVVAFLDIAGLNVEVVSKKALIDEDVVKAYIFGYLKKYHGALTIGFTQENVLAEFKEDSVFVTVNFITATYNAMKERNFHLELQNFLSEHFFEEFTVQFKSVVSENLTDFLHDSVEKIKSTLIVEEEKPRYVNVENTTEFYGELVTEETLSPQSVKTAQQGIAVAGKVSNFIKKSFVSKQKNEQGGFIERDYFSFQLSHHGATLGCVVFLPQLEVEKFEELQDGEFVAVFGDSEEFNGRINFKVKKLSLCTPGYEPEDEVEYKDENENYVFIKPEPYITLAQSNLFDVSDKVNSFLLNNDVVVFDFETTGLDAGTNEIIEIGAAKLVKGKIVETFSALIKPKGVISEEITQITGITNEMVANEYSIEQVLPDFYKFTRNSVLTAYNIAFDYNFLYAISKKLAYNFNNRQIDTMYLARTKLHGLKNYRLKSVATALDVALDNAHRAVFDAIATAEVFIKLSDDLK